MKKQTWVFFSIIIALLFVSSIFTAVTVASQELQEEMKNNKEKLLSLQQEYSCLQQNYSDLQQNYTDQQHEFMEIFKPSLETALGAKVLYDSKAAQNYLWVTGEVYNRGYGMAFNTLLQVKLFTANSSVRVVSVYSLGDIDAHNFQQVRKPFYSDVKIERWEIDVNCSIAK
jgi:hypothetical protein